MKKNLRIVFSRSRKKFGIFAWLIIWWDKKRHNAYLPISHVSGKWFSRSWDAEFIYQATGAGTHFMGGTLFRKKNEIIEEWVLELPSEIEEKIGRACVEREGIPYAKIQTLGIAISAIIWLITFGRFDIKNPFRDGDSETNCLEEWGYLLQEAYGLKFPGDLEKATPWQFRLWIESLPGAKLVDKKV